MTYPLSLHQRNHRADAKEQRQEEETPPEERRQPDVPGNMPSRRRALIIVLDGVGVLWRIPGGKIMGIGGEPQSERAFTRSPILHGNEMRKHRADMIEAAQDDRDGEHAVDKKNLCAVWGETGGKTP